MSASSTEVVSLNAILDKKGKMTILLSDVKTWMEHKDPKSCGDCLMECIESRNPIALHASDALNYFCACAQIVNRMKQPDVSQNEKWKLLMGKYLKSAKISKIRDKDKEIVLSVSFLSFHLSSADGLLFDSSYPSGREASILTLLHWTNGCHTRNLCQSNQVIISPQ